MSTGKYTKSTITRTQKTRWPYWKVGNRETSGHSGFEIQFSNDGECVTDHVYEKEDANLMAAAPLMYETLVYLQFVGGLGLDVHKYIKQAINVAEGKDANEDVFH